MEFTAMIHGRPTNCNADSLVCTFQYETQDLPVRHEKVPSKILPYADVLVSIGLDWTVVTVYDQNISQIVESMQAFPPRLMYEAMQKLGTIM